MKRIIPSLLTAGFLALASFTWADEITKAPITENDNTSLEQIIDSVVCLRNTTVYESISYDSNGEIQKERDESVSFGTGFCFAKEGDWYYIVTNHHVANNPPMRTSYYENYKKIKETITIVDDIYDEFKKDDIELEFIGSSEELDIALLRTKSDLSVGEYKIADAAELKEGDGVMMVGYPLGVIMAVTEGVISNLEYKHVKKMGHLKQEHIDLVVDCATNPGNSGSPVFKINGDGTYSWIGQLHAGYSGEGLKLAVRIDQFRHIIENKEFPEPKQVEEIKFEDYQKLLTYVKGNDVTHNYKFNEFDLNYHSVLNSDIKDVLYLTVYNKDYPTDPEIKYELVDEKKYGLVDYLVIDNREYGHNVIKKKDLTPELQKDMQSYYEKSAELINCTIEYRKLLNKSQNSKEDSEAAEQYYDETLVMKKDEVTEIQIKFHKELKEYLDDNFL